MSIIVSKLHFFQIKREVFLGYPMEFNQSFFSITPEAFKSINIYFTRGKYFTMINPQMPITTKHECIIAFKFIRVNNRSAPYGFNSHGKYRLCGNIFNNIYSDYPVSLEYSKYRNLIPGTSTSLTLASASKICFIKLYFTMKRFLGVFIARYYSKPNKIYRFMYRWITQFNLLRYLSCRYLKFKKLNYPEPLLVWYFNPIKPSITKVMERISTTFTSISFVNNSIYFIAITSCAKNMAIFPAIFLKKQTSLVLCFAYIFKCI